MIKAAGRGPENVEVRNKTSKSGSGKLTIPKPLCESMIGTSRTQVRAYARTK
jgi:hypothetical protein